MEILETARLLLRPFTVDDAQAVYAYASHPEVGPPAGWNPHGSVEESRRVIETIFMPAHTLAVVRKSDGRLIGSAGYVGKHRPELGLPSEEVGYALARDCWGQGLIPEAVEAILRHAFMEEGYAAIWAAYYDGNWKADHMNGSGTYHYSAAEYPYLSGNFENDVPSGTLTYYKEVGNTFETKWENGNCISVKET